MILSKGDVVAINLKTGRVSVKGKFLYWGNEKFYIKGVTYGTFQPGENDCQFPGENIVDTDFRLMAESGINSVRTYTVPPMYLLDLALKYNLKVMVGLPWEQHITFLETTELKNDIIHRVQESVASCNQHPAILCYTIGNEIPATIVRWYGKKKIEKFLKELYKAAKVADPQSLVTYVNFPTTEYLDLDFLDFDCFNVYLETPEKLGAYIARLHNLSGDRPLLLAEIGLDSMRNGESLQAETLRWQIKTVFSKGCAGMFVFAWTDEWWRGGFEIEDWDFGIVDRQRRPKKALYAVSDTMGHVPFENNGEFPFISVVVCSFNGAATIRDCMEGLQKLDYPKYEVIVVDDGSRDNLAEIVKQYPVKLISTENHGLSSARNTGMYHAKGSIVAYIDDDAYPDPHWLRYMAYAFLNTGHAAIGGPNIAPPEDGAIAKSVANAPGGPVHVLFDDELAEHIPGCNMAFRKSALMNIGGFDPVFRSAGDDVDVCWRIQNSGETIGFHPSAMVWHHRRNSIKAYWKQQLGYGKAEALLERKWPEKYNGFGHLAWGGRIYGNGFTMPLKIKKDKIFHGVWGTALFQSVYQPAEGFLTAIPLMPEWYLFTAQLALLACLGFFWAPLLWAWPVVLGSIFIVLIQAFVSATKNVSHSARELKTPKYKALITYLHIIQPLARLYGRLNHGLTPWKKGRKALLKKFRFPLDALELKHWSEEWKEAEYWLSQIENKLKSLKERVSKGGEFDRYDLQVRNTLLSKSRSILAIEEHGAGKQFLRFKIWHVPSVTFLIALAALIMTSLLAALDHRVIVTIALAAVAIGLFIEYLKDSVHNQSSMYKAFKSLELLSGPASMDKGIFPAETSEITGKNGIVLLDKTLFSSGNNHNSSLYELHKEV